MVDYIKEYAVFGPFCESLCPGNILILFCSIIFLFSKVFRKGQMKRFLKSLYRRNVQTLIIRESLCPGNAKILRLNRTAKVLASEVSSFKVQKHNFVM